MQTFCIRGLTELTVTVISILKEGPNKSESYSLIYINF